MHQGFGEGACALSFGDSCFQLESGSEDCLFLNIWTPYLPKPQKPPLVTGMALKPVMFWLHGDVYEFGTGSNPTFDGGNLARRRRCHQHQLSARDPRILALEWVRQNIQDFGGNPERIPIFGQSAGVASVRAMMASLKAAGKFSGAIAMSNPDGFRRPKKSDELQVWPQGMLGSNGTNIRVHLMMGIAAEDGTLMLIYPRNDTSDNVD
ncbi:Cholinesterase 4 [Colletotrichum chlorophyti]|uniref:Carboxylic ester hydrolase n=1 Tax=Colletotrichum chlorophyti TaxID=708187 RepID=A0A1Q8S5G0_9PEZI|nr:Cholinesterase 4 [Colletotrichum chlorophyti]